MCDARSQQSAVSHNNIMVNTTACNGPGQLSASYDAMSLVCYYYEGRPINKLQNGIILSIFKI